MRNRTTDVFPVIPAQAGIQGGRKGCRQTAEMLDHETTILHVALDSRLRGNDDEAGADGWV